MRVEGIDCEYKMLNEYFGHCGSKTSPKMTEDARKKILKDLDELVVALNQYARKHDEYLKTAMKGENPPYGKYNNYTRNYDIFSELFVPMLPDIRNGAIYFNSLKFKQDFFDKFASNEVASLVSKMAYMANRPQYDFNSNFEHIFDIHEIDSKRKIKQLYSNGNYVGGMDLAKGCKFGIGTYNWNNGDKYVGEWKNDLMHGDGEYLYATGDKKRYVGFWCKNKRCGEGTLQYRNGNKYVGCFRNNNRHGYGVLTLNNGDKYKGIWENDKMSILGEYIWANGDKYIGEMKNGSFNGLGAKIYKNGQIKLGYWEDSNPVNCRTWTYGEGYDDLYPKVVYYNYEEDDAKYFGETTEGGGIHGKGILMWVDYGFSFTDIYIGNFFSGKKEGHGCFLWNDHDYYIGEWKNGERHGKGYMYSSDGESKYSVWVDGEENKMIEEYGVDGEKKNNDNLSASKYRW